MPGDRCCGEGLRLLKKIALFPKVFYKLLLTPVVAAVAQLVEHRIVIPGVAGSTPVSRPISKKSNKN